MDRKCLWLAILLMATVPCSVQAEDVDLELIMPGTLFGPGSPFSLDLQLENSGPSLEDVPLFVAMSIADFFWFYPSWVLFPPDVDSQIVDLPTGVYDTWSILPEFPWPEGAGEYTGAMFYAVVIDGDELASNLAYYSFGWTEDPVPTATPEPTTTPDPSTPTPTQTAAPTAFIPIPAGSFTMGSPSDEPCRGDDEAQHEVTLTRGFEMQQVEVTRGMWAALRAEQPTLPDDPSFTDSSPTMNHPVQSVTWFESILYANLLSLADGYTRCYYTDEAFTTPIDATSYTTGPFHCDFEADGYRLPTESEWEYAARAGTTAAFSCSAPDYTEENCAECTEGTHPSLEEYCLYCANNPGTTEPVGSKLPNPWDLYDVHGSVWEWCWDWYGDYPTGPVTDPTGAEDGTSRSRRGGAWRLLASQCRSASRFLISPDYRFTFQGLRVVRTAD